MNLNEDTDLHDLMVRSTEGLTLASDLGHGIAVRQRRRHLRRQLASVAVTGVAASVAVISVQSTGSSSGTPKASASPTIQLTASQRALFGLADAAADNAVPKGRYAVLKEIQTETGSANSERTSVLDSISGDSVTYQHGVGIPSEFRSAAASPTAAQFAALPRDPKALAAALIKQADAQWAEDSAAEAKLAKPGMNLPIRADTRSDADKVFEQAADMLWNPLVQPTLRESLYRVLADTEGVEVVTGARDRQGRAAVLLRHTSTDTNGYTSISVYEDQVTGQTLETDYATGSPTSVASDVYLSSTRTDSIPANPYTS